MMCSAIYSNSACIVLASGPSLTSEDIETVRQSGIKTIAVNSTIFAAPWADICFAADQHWWWEYQVEVEKIGCRMVCSNPGARGRGLEIVDQHSDPYVVGKASGKNSGHKAICFAMMEGAKNIILLGFDCIANGHHHGDHPACLGPKPKASAYDIWREDFNELAKSEHGCYIVNCSRNTSLECFPRISLDRALWALKQQS